MPRRLAADERGAAGAASMRGPLTAARPSRTLRDRLPAVAPLVVLAAWTLLVTAILARLAIDNHYVFRDEANAILLGRWISQDVSQAITGSVARGPERMTSLFAAVAASLLDGPTRQVELLHLWAAFCEGLMAVPLWLAARQLGLGRWQALVPATIASSGSFAFYGIFTLNGAVGSLAAAFLLWAMARALARPGLASDLLVGGTLGLLALSRIGWAPIVVALAPAVLAAAWFERPPGERVRSWIARLPGRLLRRHPLLMPLALVLLGVVVVAGPSLLLGGKLYGGSRLGVPIELDVLWDNTRTLGAHLAIGAAIVPLVLALPFLVRGLVRPATPLEGGFAWLVLGLVLVFSYAYYASMNEDRYFAVLLPPLTLAGALAVFRRPPPLWSIVVSGALVVALVASSYAWPVQDVFSYFTAPTSRFFADVVVGKLTQRLPGSATLSAALATAAAALAAVLAARSISRGRGALAASGAVLAGVLVFQLAAMDHPARKFTQIAGMTEVPAASLELLDRAPGGGEVRPLAVDGVIDPDLAAQLQMFEGYNASLSLSPFSIHRDPATPAQPREATLDWSSGRIRTSHPPQLLLQMAEAEQVGVVGRKLPAREPFPWAQLVRPQLPLRAAWMVGGTGPDRYPEAGTPVVVRVFPARRPHACLTGQLSVNPFAEAPARYRLSGGGQRRSGLLQPKAPRAFQLPVSATRATQFVLAGQARRLSNGTVRGPTVYGLAVTTCSGR
jgi:hypothetical protein